MHMAQEQVSKIYLEREGTTPEVRIYFYQIEKVVIGQQ
jgi:hypothetical protein